MSLTGKTILVTRAKEQASELSALINEHGGTAIEVPLLAFEPLLHEERIDHAMIHLGQYKWLMFTSVNGVHYFMERYNMIYPNQHILPVSIAVVGEKTEAALLKYEVKADLMPTDYSAEGMVDVLVDHVQAGDRVLLARGNRGRSVLNTALTNIGAQLDDLTIYETNFPRSAKSEFKTLLQKKIPIDYVTFTSSSTVSHYVDLLKRLGGERGHFQPKVACIGPIAAKTATDLGLHVDLVPAKYTIESLVEQLVIDTNKEGAK